MRCYVMFGAVSLGEMICSAECIGLARCGRRGGVRRSALIGGFRCGDLTCATE